MAFRRLDFNRDGFLTEEDFLEVFHLRLGGGGGLQTVINGNHAYFRNRRRFNKLESVADPVAAGSGRCGEQPAPENIPAL